MNCIKVSKNLIFSHSKLVLQGLISHDISEYHVISIIQIDLNDLNFLSISSLRSLNYDKT